MKAKCPYCGRKITYGTRLLEKGEGEHYCKHCKKPSNIVLDKGIWAVFAACAVFSILVLLFYFTFGTVAQHEYNIDGSNAVLVAIFFGKLKTLKWILWEMLPFVAFFFVSPLFVKYTMQKKYAYQSSDRIDLGTGFIPPVNNSETSDNNGSTRVIPKMGATRVDDDFEFENISSNSGKTSDTRSFNLRESMVEVNPESYTKSASFRSDAPLKKVERVKPEKISEPQELYRVKVLREQELRKAELKEKAKEIDKAGNEKNYSANRKF
ncbi:MAG: hypothetical protein IJZ54_04245 [Clostridia bacterium]|nr:hypothetical protein [Clostridia bacterium]